MAGKSVQARLVTGWYRPGRRSVTSCGSGYGRGEVPGIDEFMRKTTRNQGPQENGYQIAGQDASGGGDWVLFRAAVRVPRRAVDSLAAGLRRRWEKQGTRWRKLDAEILATLTIAYLRTNLTFAELAQGNGVDKSTMCRNIHEGIRVLAGRAVRLKDVVRLARKSGWEYLLVDGTLVSVVAFGRKVTPKQKHYSGKHKRHGVNVQTVCAPDGTLLWCSAALPGATCDITAFREHGIARKTGDLLALLGDLGYKGADGVITGKKKPRGGQLTDAEKTANRVHASLRSIGERGNAQLKYWRVMATELRCRPENCTRIVKACLALHYLVNNPFAG
jgi:hypothetical protein